MLNAITSGGLFFIDCIANSGYLNRLMDDILDLRNENDIFLILALGGAILYYHFYIKENKFELLKLPKIKLPKDILALLI